MSASNEPKPAERRRRFGSPFARAAALVSLASLAAACQAIIGLTDYTPKDAPPGADAADDAGSVDAGADVGVDAYVECPSLPKPAATATPVDAAAFPPPPDGGVTNEWPIFALHDLSLDVGSSGLDLDCRNTQGGQDVPCVGSPNDLDGGIDVSFNATLAALLPGADPVAAKLNFIASSGQAAILLRVDNTSALLPRDATGLRVGFNSSPGLYSVGCGAPRTPDGGPLWDGCDTWVAGTFANNSGEAWLVDGKLVAHFGAVSVNLGTATLSINEAVLIADVVTGDGGPMQLTGGKLAGRVKAVEAVSAASRYDFNGVICTQPIPAESLRTALCGGRDLPTAGRGSATATCDSLSIGITFKATQAHHGGAIPDAGVLPDPCASYDASCQ